MGGHAPHGQNDASDTRFVARPGKGRGRAPCVRTLNAPMCLIPYVIRIRCMQYKLRGSEVVLPYIYSFLHLPAGPQCPSVTAAAPT